MNHARWCTALLTGLLWLPAQAAPSVAMPERADGAETIFANGFERSPNILLVILDDVGVDQVASFGYGGGSPPPPLPPQSPPQIPNIDAIADDGLRFRNTWAMPECSPTRAALFTGRYPLRTNVLAAIGENDLANSHVSPYEVTLPKLLRHAGYESALFGKFHLGGPENNPAGNGLPGQLGFDWFEGWIGGLPGSIDTTAGGVAPDGTYSCGFVPSLATDSVSGADSGACYLPQAGGGTQCEVLVSGVDPAGLQCLTRGGILVPNAACAATPPANLVWNRENAHYVSPMVLNHDGKVEERDLADPAGRGYRATIEVDSAIRWIRARADSQRPWMATVAFSNAHTPLQNPPASLLPSGAAPALGADCRPATRLNQRRLFDAMFESTDTEIGRLLTQTGLAVATPDGGLEYHADASNTVIVVVGDNGSFGPTVKLPFDPQRSKGTAYQAGVWVPLVVAGPMVKAPGRSVEQMVNTTDLYRLFAEIAGLDVRSLVPRTVDAASMLPYLTTPDMPSIRDVNFAQGDLNIQVGGGRNGPCVIGGQCTHTPTNAGVCADNGGEWWGIGSADPKEYCWEVNQAIYHQDPAAYDEAKVKMAWTRYQALRNDNYKLVRNYTTDYDPKTDGSVEVVSEELYRIDQTPGTPLLDSAERDLLADGKLTTEQAVAYVHLGEAMDAIVASDVACPGDGDDDGRVDQADLDNYFAIIAPGWNGSSWYDIDLDGHTDATDLAVIQAHLGTPCPGVP